MTILVILDNVHVAWASALITYDHTNKRRTTETKKAHSNLIVTKRKERQYCELKPFFDSKRCICVLTFASSFFFVRIDSAGAP